MDDRNMIAAMVRELLERSELAIKVRQMQGAEQSVTLSITAGAVLYPAPGGLTAASRISIVSVAVTSHWSFVVFPAPYAGGFVVQNNGANQDVTLRYVIT